MINLIKKSWLLILLVVLTINKSNSQESESNSVLIIPKAEILNNKLGFAASMFSGYGVSYGYRINNNYALEFTTSIYGEGGSKYKTSYNNSYLTSTLGFEFQRSIYVSSDSRFYALAGVSYWYNSNNNSRNNTNIQIDNSETNYVGGLSLGWEIVLGKRYVINIEGGYLYRQNSYQGEIPYNSSTYNLGSGAGGGVYYAF
ncbi:MAG: outer membrane beta-barrel protein [Candidatus Kapabacteria bacterium]|nr:outer membrane beta-barrel protein [Candidatus Kapabacteria bacterium]